jgi:hypothetical protein
MAAMPEETRLKIAASVRRAWESPAVRKRAADGIRKAWESPARRKALSQTMREYWAQRRAAKITAMEVSG